MHFRDIKLENILLDSDNVMKVIDFGLSAFFVPGKRLRVHCGSPSYAAPEIVARKLYDGPPVVREGTGPLCLAVTLTLSTLSILQLNQSQPLPCFELGPSALVAHGFM